MPGKRAVFLDRDGVINRECNFVTSWSEFEFLPGIVKAIGILNEAGILVIIITNQSGIKRGYFTENTMHEIHRNMQRILAERGAWVDDIYFCPHTDEEHCECRKPKPGMLIAAADEHGIDLLRSWVIGDSPRDVTAGRRVGCQTQLFTESDDIGEIINRII